VSIRVVAAIFATRIRPPIRKLVALALANAARDDGTGVFPGRERLVRETSIPAREVRRQIAALIEEGIVVEVRRAHTGTRREFRIELDRLGSLAREEVRDDPQEEVTGDLQSEERGGHPRPERGSPMTGEGVTRDPPYVLLRPQPSLETLSPSSDRFDEFYAAYPRKVGRKAARKAWDKALRDGAQTAEILAGVRRYTADPNLPSDRRYVPHPASWLNAGRWDDEPEPPSPASVLIQGLLDRKGGDTP
jgi:hypothetical protein